MDQSPKNPHRDTGVWREEIGGERERVVALDGSLWWLMVSERAGMGVSPESVNRGMEWLSMA